MLFFLTNHQPRKMKASREKYWNQGWASLWRGRLSGQNRSIVSMRARSFNFSSSEHLEWISLMILPDDRFVARSRSRQPIFSSLPLLPLDRITRSLAEKNESWNEKFALFPKKKKKKRKDEMKNDWLNPLDSFFRF